MCLGVQYQGLDLKSLATQLHWMALHRHSGGREVPIFYLCLCLNV